jgi:hypothetical protein
VASAPLPSGREVRGGKISFLVIDGDDLSQKM